MSNNASKIPMSPYELGNLPDTFKRVIANTSAFGDVGEDYVVMGAHGNKLPLSPLPLFP